MILCYVTDRHLLGEDSPSALLQSSERAAAAGIDWIQIREKDLPARELSALTRNIIAVTRQFSSVANTPPRVIVNDRLDVALAAGAAGVHLSGASAPPAEVVRWLRAGNAPSDFSVGVSCHSLAEVQAAENAGANYVFFGPIYETPSKLDFGPPQGIDALSEACRSARIPVLAIGGITESNARACIRAGAAGIAAIRVFQEVSDATHLHAIVLRLRASN